VSNILIRHPLLPSGIYHWCSSFINESDSTQMAFHPITTPHSTSPSLTRSSLVLSTGILTTIYTLPQKAILLLYGRNGTRHCRKRCYSTKQVERVVSLETLSLRWTRRIRNYWRDVSSGVGWHRRLGSSQDTLRK
jgi:hypothetical protein